MEHNIHEAPQMTKDVDDLPVMLVVKCYLLCWPGGAAAVGIGYGNQSSDYTVTTRPGSDPCDFTVLCKVGL